jgi:hypothetical protein
VSYSYIIQSQISSAVETASQNGTNNFQKQLIKNKNEKYKMEGKDKMSNVLMLNLYSEFLVYMAHI